MDALDQLRRERDVLFQRLGGEQLVLGL